MPFPSNPSDRAARRKQSIARQKLPKAKVPVSKRYPIKIEFSGSRQDGVIYEITEKGLRYFSTQSIDSGLKVRVCFDEGTAHSGVVDAITRKCQELPEGARIVSDFPKMKFQVELEFDLEDPQAPGIIKRLMIRCFES